MFGKVYCGRYCGWTNEATLCNKAMLAAFCSFMRQTRWVMLMCRISAGMCSAPRKAINIAKSTVLHMTCTNGQCSCPAHDRCKPSWASTAMMIQLEIQKPLHSKNIDSYPGGTHNFCCRKISPKLEARSPLLKVDVPKHYPCKLAGVKGWQPEKSKT